MVAFNLSHVYSKLSPFASHDKDMLKLFTLKVMDFDKGCRVTLGRFTKTQKESNYYCMIKYFQCELYFSYVSYLRHVYLLATYTSLHKLSTMQ